MDNSRGVLYNRKGIKFQGGTLMSALNLSTNSRTVLEKRYLMRNEHNQVIETPEELFQRVAQNIAEAEKLYDGDLKKTTKIFYKLMTELNFLPNSPTLMNAGGDLQQLSACFVLPVEDSMEKIFESVKHTAMIQKSGGGTGFSFSCLRPKNDIVRSTGGVASGPISFMQVFDSATNTVKQGGKRRGANMGILRIDHPDILDFITCKHDENVLNNFNISVAITENFMEAVINDQEYELINPYTKQAVKSLSAKEVFQLIVKMAHTNGEPGIIFIDRINRDNPTPHLGEIESTNPCGEQPLLAYEACNLGSINLAKMVKAEGDKLVLDYHKLARVINDAVHFLDNVIDMNRYPLPKIDEMVRGNRKIGLGVMGWADLLIQLGIPYNSETAIELAEKVMGFINEHSKLASQQLAKKRGAFPNIEGSIYTEPIRNATTTTIAPTGSISIIANSSSGIEPIFAISYQRNVMDSTLIEVHPLFAEIAQKRGFYSQELIEKIAQHASIQEITEIPEDVRKIFVTAHDVSPEWHIKTQAAFQKHVDNAVSKTVNLAHQATLEDVAQVYELAYQLGCKGVTIYRDGSRSAQVLATKKEENKPNTKAKTKRPRPNITLGTTEKTKIGCGKLYITINSDQQGICEVFTSTGRGGGCRSQSEATSRLISLALRSGIPIEEITHQLKGIRCAAAIKRKGVTNVSCPDAIARAIENFLGYTKDNPMFATNVATNDDEYEMIADENNGTAVCPDCGEEVEHEGGCVICRSCGYSKCG